MRLYLYYPARLVVRGLLLVLLYLVALGSSSTFAAVSGLGDITPFVSSTDFEGNPIDIPDLPATGGDIGGPIVIGGTGSMVSNMNFGSMTINNPLFTNPLESTDSIIGDESYGAGEAIVSGFGSAWEVSSILTIGNEGQGTLDLEGGARVSVGNYSTNPAEFTTGDIIVGDQPFSQGIVTVDGFASVLETEDMFIGEEGTATVDVSNRGTLRSDVAVIGNMEGSIGRVTLTGLGTRWINTGTTINDFNVGEEGQGTLEIFDQAQALAMEDVRVGRLAGSRGVVRVSGLGSLWQIDDNPGSGTGEDLEIGLAGVGEVYVTDGGIIRASGTTSVGAASFVEIARGGILSSNLVTIDGVVRGAGRVESSVTINTTGELRNHGESGNYPPEEALLVTGPVVNNGTVEAFGGEMEFGSVVTNNFAVVARDAVMRFSAGMTNDGTISVGGDTTLHGPISGIGDIFVLSDSESLLVGDLTFSASSILSLTVGDAAGTLDVQGAVELGGAALKLDYSAGIASQSGDTYQIFSASDAITGAFSNPGAPPQVVADGRLWDITVNTNAIFVTATGTLITPSSGDFDLDFDVDGSDFLAWQRGFMNPPQNYNATDLANWQVQYGSTIPLNAAALSAVPEPSALLLASLAVGCCAIRRRCS